MDWQTLRVNARIENDGKLNGVVRWWATKLYLPANRCSVEIDLHAFADWLRTACKTQRDLAYKEYMKRRGRKPWTEPDWKRIAAYWLENVKGQQPCGSWPKHRMDADDPALRYYFEETAPHRAPRNTTR